MLLAHLERIIDVSKKLNMSQAAISMSIRELERLVDDQLFDRVSKRLILNERGKKLLEEVAPCVTQLENVYYHFKSQKISGKIQIAASVTIMDYFMPNLINDYMKERTGIELELKSANSDEVIKLLQQGACDIAFIEGDYEDETLDMINIQQDKLVIVSSDPNLKKNGPHYIDRLASKKWILREKGSGTRSIFINEIAPIDQELNLFIELDHTEAIKNLLLLDPEYISCVSRISVQSMLDKGKLFEIDIIGHTFERHFTYLVRKNKKRTLLFDDFIQFLEASMT